VYFIENCHDCGKYNQEKLFVPVYCVEEPTWGTVTLQWWGFYINSFPQNLAPLQICDLQLHRGNHPFLTKNSWLNVNRIHKYPDSSLSEERGIIASQYHSMILQAVKDCPVLETKHKKKILVLQN